MRKILLITLGLLIVAPTLSGCNAAFLKGIAGGMAKEYNRGSSSSSSTDRRIEKLEAAQKRMCSELEDVYHRCLSYGEGICIPPSC